VSHVGGGVSVPVVVVVSVVGAADGVGALGVGEGVGFSHTDCLVVVLNQNGRPSGVLCSTHPSSTGTVGLVEEEEDVGGGTVDSEEVDA